MQGDTTVIEHPNCVLKNGLTAINRYFEQSRMYKDRGIHKLGDHEYSERFAVGVGPGLGAMVNHAAAELLENVGWLEIEVRLLAMSPIH